LNLEAKFFMLQLRYRPKGLCENCIQKKKLRTLKIAENQYRGEGYEWTKGSRCRLIFLGIRRVSDTKKREKVGAQKNTWVRNGVPVKTVNACENAGTK